MQKQKAKLQNKNVKRKFKIEKDQKKKIEIVGSGEYVVELLGEGAEVEIVGVFVGRGEEVVDVKVEIVHKSGNTRADTVLKGVGYDKSKIRFEGRIIIVPGCPNTNSFLEERILLLSDEARAEAVPDLEIESDDVKCSHAASVSRIPEEQVFYLMSRGLDREKAEGMIVDGFLEIN